MFYRTHRKRGFQPIVLAALFLCCLAQPAFSAAPQDSATARSKLIDLPDADTATAILGGHLRLTLPQGALLQRRGDFEPGAPLFDDARTNLLIPAGDERLVIKSFEIFQQYRSDFEQEGRAYLRGYGDQLADMIIQPMGLPGGLKVLAFQPKNIVINRVEIFLMGLLVAHPADSSIQEIRFYCNRPAIAFAPDLVTIVRRISNSLRAGQGKLSPAGTNIDLVSGPRLQLTLDQPSFVTSQVGSDFSVDRLALPARLGAFRGKLGIYRGARPSFQHDAAENALDHRVESAQILGAPHEWRYWSQADEDNSRAWFVETIVPHPTESGQFLHIFASAATPELLDQLRRQAERIRVVN